MRILVVGGGGREHALCWAIGASPLCDALFCAPGNVGIASEATCVPVKADDLDGLVALAQAEAIDLVVVGPEAPLVLGLVDRLQAAGIRAFGPTAAAARLEGSKAFLKDLCQARGIPTAQSAAFTDADAAIAHVRQTGAPIVVKADGLAAGKGVVVATTVAEAEAAVTGMLVDRRFGAAGATVVIEDCLTGPEASFFALVDGRVALPLAGAQDYKRAGDGDVGPNTGGMGAVSPTPRLDAALEARVMAEIITPTVTALADAGTPFTGVLYAGLMLTPDGPKLLEYNVRFGDPECQVLMARLASDLVPALVAACDGALNRISLRWRDDAAVVVVMAADGYPDQPVTGTLIAGLDGAEQGRGVLVFHAGTRAAEGGIVAAGGRVLGVTATGATVAAARTAAYGAVDAIDWPGGWCRRDIGADVG